MCLSNDFRLPCKNALLLLKQCRYASELVRNYLHSIGFVHVKMHIFEQLKQKKKRVTDYRVKMHRFEQRVCDIRVKMHCCC